MQESQADTIQVGRTANFTTRLQLIEMVGVFVVGACTLLVGKMVLGNRLASQVGSIWAANLSMLTVIYGGLRCRGQGWSHFGLSVGPPNLWSTAKTFLQSLPVFVVATTAFVAGAIIMANVVGVPEPADMSKYDHLQGNLTMTILALGSVYVSSAFAEELIYRGFLITRISEMAAGQRWWRYLAVLISALVFGLVHSDWGLTGMVQASFMGLALGAAYLVVHRNLWVTILAHAYMVTLLVLQMYFATSTPVES